MQKNHADTDEVLQLMSTSNIRMRGKKSDLSDCGMFVGCQIGWFEYLWICWSARILMHNSQRTTLYNHNEKTSISECKTSLRQMVYNSRRPHCVQLPSAKNRRLQCAQAFQFLYWTVLGKTAALFPGFNCPGFQ